MRTSPTTVPIVKKLSIWGNSMDVHPGERVKLLLPLSPSELVTTQAPPASAPSTCCSPRPAACFYLFLHSKLVKKSWLPLPLLMSLTLFMPLKSDIGLWSITLAVAYHFNCSLNSVNFIVAYVTLLSVALDLQLFLACGSFLTLPLDCALSLFFNKPFPTSISEHCLQFPR